MVVEKIATLPINGLRTNLALLLYRKKTEWSLSSFSLFNAACTTCYLVQDETHSGMMAFCLVATTRENDYLLPSVSHGLASAFAPAG